MYNIFCLPSWIGLHSNLLPHSLLWLWLGLTVPTLMVPMGHENPESWPMRMPSWTWSLPSWKHTCCEDHSRYPGRGWDETGSSFQLSTKVTAQRGLSWLTSFQAAPSPQACSLPLPSPIFFFRVPVTFWSYPVSLCFSYLLPVFLIRI